MAVNNREIIIEIGPFSEWQGALANALTGVRIVSNGSLGTFKADVRCQKNMIEFPNDAVIRIWNLKPSTRQQFKKAGLFVRVYAGYEGGSHEMIFSGSLMQTIHKRVGPDIVTTLTCMTGGSALQMSTFSKTYAQGVPVIQIVAEMAAALPGVIVDPTQIKVSGTIGYKGFSYNGSTMNGLSKLANQFGFSWSIDNGVFVAVEDMAARRSTSILLNRNSGLIEVSPRMFGINQAQEGVDISCLYTQGIEAGHTIRVESDVDSSLTDNYICHTIEYDLSPKESNWNMQIYSFKPKV